MKEDKIIRTISEIDDAYILEAAPDQPSMRYRRRFFTGRVIGITAAAAAAVIGLVVGGIALIRPSRNKSAMDAAKEGIVSQAGKESYAAIDNSAVIPAASEAGKSAAPVTAAEAEAPEQDVRAEDAYQDAVNEVRHETPKTAAAETGAVIEHWEGPNFTFRAMGPNGEYLIFIYLASSQIETAEAEAKITLLSESADGTLYLAEPSANIEGGDVTFGRFILHVKPELAPKEVEVHSGDTWPSEMPEEMQKLYDEAMKN